MLTIAMGQLAANSPYQKLVSLNAEWAYHASAMPETFLDDQLNSDVDWIRQHLLLVHRDLKKAHVSHLSEEQRQNRERGLEELLSYAQAGEFPQNLTFSGRRPVFIDQRGVHCAVGYLIMKSGHSELSNRISRNMNYYYLKRMEDKELNDWVECSGFTLDELAWIQPGYFQPINYQPLKGGLNGPVNAIITDNNAGLFVGGSFDTAGQSAAGNIANYFSGFAGFDWMGVGNGISGTVHDMIYYHNELYVAGNIYMADSTFVNSGVVKWTGSKWEVIGDFYTGALVNYVRDLEVYRDTLYAGGFFRAKMGVAPYFESVAKWDGTQWVHAGADLTGVVHKMHVHNNKLVIGGDFWLNTGAPIKNICRLNGNQIEFMAQGLPLPVNDLETFNNELYVATDFTNGSMTDTLGLAVYRNGKWERIFDGTSTSKFATGGIKALAEVSSAGALVIGGDFKISALFGNFGKNMGVYRNSHVSAFGAVDSTVRTLEVINNTLYLGGDFTSSGFQPAAPWLNHIAAVAITPNFGVEEVRAEVNLYPNPAFKTITLEAGGANFTDVELFDLTGRNVKVKAMERAGKLEIDVSGLQPGTYILRAVDGNARLERRVVVK